MANESLKSLDISGNNITSDGIRVLASAIKDKSSLKSLELSYNPIGPEGAKAIADIVKRDLQVIFKLSNF